jgi:transposase
MSPELLLREVPADCLVVAIDPGKVSNRVWLTSGERGLIGEPVSLPVLREGVDELERLIEASRAGAPVIGIEATGALHRAWAAEVERRWAGVAAVVRTVRDAGRPGAAGLAAIQDRRPRLRRVVWLLRQGAGRPSAPSQVEALLGAVRHRRQLVDARRVLQQRLHDQLNALCPGLSAPAGHGRVLELEHPSGRAVLACAAAFAGRAPSARSLLARSPGRLTEANARFWAQRWKRLLAPPADAELRAQRLGRDIERWLGLREDSAALEAQSGELLAGTDGQILTTLNGVAVVRAAAFAAHTLPIERWPTPEQLFSATGLAPASYQSASVTRRGRISRQGLAEHRDALMGIAWGLSQHSPAFRRRDGEYRARGFRPIQARVALARHACRLAWRLMISQQPYDDRRYDRARHRRGR